MVEYSLLHNPIQACESMNCDACIRDKDGCLNSGKRLEYKAKNLKK